MHGVNVHRRRSLVTSLGVILWLGLNTATSGAPSPLRTASEKRTSQNEEGRGGAVGSVPAS